MRTASHTCISREARAEDPGTCMLSMDVHDDPSARYSSVIRDTPVMSPRSMLCICTPISGAFLDAHAEQSSGLAEAHGYRSDFVVTEMLCTFAPCLSAPALIPRDRSTLSSTHSEQRYSCKDFVCLARR